MINKAGVLLILFLCITKAIYAQPAIKVGAKHFNEGYILGEMISILLEDAGFKVERSFNLGGTAIIFEALKNKNIDIYPEYTGTISSEILKSPYNLSLYQQRELVRKRFGLEISKPLGFNNTYALLIKPEKAQELNIHNISDLKSLPELKVGLSYEFLKRQDGWINLSQQYRLPHTPMGLEHGLAYQAILNNNIDITDAYSTDGEINRYDLMLLQDDLQFFPEYQAIFLYSATIPMDAKKLINKLNNTISAEEMQYLNSLALFENKSHYEIAFNFLVENNLIQGQASALNAQWREILSKTLVHIELTLIALIAAVIIAVPLGIFIYMNNFLIRSTLYVAGIFQTIPSIALLALMIPVFGIGIIPAIVALFIYALLPILRNTVIGLYTVDPELKKVAVAIGLDDWKRMRLVEIPLAMPSILTGIRTAAVINVGTATLAAFIGAGGLGEFIVTGLALNNMNLILMGAIPAALLAIIFELLFELLEHMLIPGHLRQKI